MRWAGVFELANIVRAQPGERLELPIGTRATHGRALLEPDGIVMGFILSGQLQVLDCRVMGP